MEEALQVAALRSLTLAVLCIGLNEAHEQLFGLRFPALKAATGVIGLVLLWPVLIPLLLVIGTVKFFKNAARGGDTPASGD